MIHGDLGTNVSHMKFHVPFVSKRLDPIIRDEVVINITR